MQAGLLPSSLVSLLSEKLPAEASRIDEENTIPFGFWDSLREAGFFSACLPRELGGLGLGFEGLAELARLAARSSMAVAAVAASHTAVALLVYKYGGELAVDLLPRMATGELVAAAAITEPGGGSDLSSSVKTECRMEKDMCLLSGEKIFVTAATYAGLFLVLARHKGAWKAVLAPRTGNTIVEKLRINVFRGAGISHVKFDNVRVPKRNVLPGDGLKVVLDAINTGRLAYAAIGLGATEGLLEHTLAVASRKKLFGKRLLDMQGIRWRLAEIYVGVKELESLVFSAAREADSKGSVDPEKAAAAKISASRLAESASELALRIEGGRGFREGGLTERMIRDSKALGIGEGATEALLDFLADRLEKKHLATSPR